MKIYLASNSFHRQSPPKAGFKGCGDVKVEDCTKVVFQVGGGMVVFIESCYTHAYLSLPRPNFQTFWEPLGKTILKETRKV